MVCVLRLRPLVAAAELSDRYITDRFLPDKAIDLVDRRATIRTEMGSNPTELDQVNRRVMQLEIEESTLKMNLTMRANRDYKNYKKSLPMKRETSSTSILVRSGKKKK